MMNASEDMARFIEDFFDARGEAYVVERLYKSTCPHDVGKTYSRYECEICGEIASPAHNFCSNCGAKLKGVIHPNEQ